MPEDFLTRAFSQSAGARPNNEPTGPFLTAGVSEESLDEMSEPPLPMSAYTDKLFRYLMGHKRGPGTGSCSGRSQDKRVGSIDRIPHERERH